MSFNPPKVRSGLGVNVGEFKEAKYHFVVKNTNEKAHSYSLILSTCFNFSISSCHFAGLDFLSFWMLSCFH